MTRQDLTEIVIILDESGSMDSKEEEVKSRTAKLIQEQKAIPGEANLSIYTFSSFGNARYLRKRENLRQVGEIIDYHPSGNTALYDAIGAVIDDIGFSLSKIEEAQRPGKVFVVIITDGQENDSRIFSEKEVKDKIEHQQSKYNWRIEYITLGFTDLRSAMSLGVSQKNYSSCDNLSTLYGSMSCSLSSFRKS